MYITYCNVNKIKGDIKMSKDKLIWKQGMLRELYPEINGKLYIRYWVVVALSVLCFFLIFKIVY